MSRSLGNVIADSLELSLAYAERMLKDIPDEQFARFAAVGGQTIVSNHPAFIFGHLSLYPSRIVNELGGDATAITPTAEFQAVFAPSAECVDDPEGSIYPPREEIVKAFYDSYRTALQALRAVDDETLQQANPLERMAARFPTMGSMYAFYVGGHAMVHLGQLSAWRRMIGLAPA